LIENLLLQGGIYLKNFREVKAE